MYDSLKKRRIETILENFRMFLKENATQKKVFIHMSQILLSLTVALVKPGHKPDEKKEIKPLNMDPAGPLFIF